MIGNRFNIPVYDNIHIYKEIVINNIKFSMPVSVNSVNGINSIVYDKFYLKRIVISKLRYINNRVFGIEIEILNEK